MSEIDSLKFRSQRVNFNLNLYTGAFLRVWTQPQGYNNQTSIPDDSLVVPCIGKQGELPRTGHAQSWLTDSQDVNKMSLAKLR